MPHQRAKDSWLAGPYAARYRRTIVQNASSAFTSVQPPSHRSGRVNVTFRPRSGPEHRRPANAAGFSSSPQPEAMRSRTCGPTSAPTRSPSSSRVRTSSSSASPIAATVASSSAAERPTAFNDAFALNRGWVRSAATHVGRSVAGNRCRVPRISQVLTSARRSHRASRTSPALSPLTRTQAASSAADATCACRPPTSPTTSISLERGTRRAR